MSSSFMVLILPGNPLQRRQALLFGKEIFQIKNWLKKFLLKKSENGLPILLLLSILLLMRNAKCLLMVTDHYDAITLTLKTEQIAKL